MYNCPLRILKTHCTSAYMSIRRECVVQSWNSYVPLLLHCFCIKTEWNSQMVQDSLVTTTQITWHFHNSFLLWYQQGSVGRGYTWKFSLLPNDFLPGAGGGHWRLTKASAMVTFKRQGDRTHPLSSTTSFEQIGGYILKMTDRLELAG